MPKTKANGTEAAPKITKAEKELRVDKVMELIAKGLTRRAILAYVAAKTDWNIADRTVDEYIGDAYQSFKEGSAIDREKERAIAAARFNMLFELSMKVQDYQRALAAEWKRCELLGLPEPKAAQTIRLEIIQSRIDAIIQKVGSEERAAELLAIFEQELPDYVQ